MREREGRVNFSLECEREVQLRIGRVECEDMSGEEDWKNKRG